MLSRFFPGLLLLSALALLVSFTALAEGEPDEAPAPAPEMAMPEMPAPAGHDGMHAHAPVSQSGPPTIGMNIALSGSFLKGQPASFMLSFKDKDGKPVTAEHLEEVHSSIIHLLIVDESLSDYQHVHPTPDPTVPGAFQFSFTPGTTHNYKIYADVKPKGFYAQILSGEIRGAETCKDPCIDKKHVETFTLDNGAKGHVSYSMPVLAKGKQGEGHVYFFGKEGKPLEKALEPVMGAFAHIVGFYDDGATVQHVHPVTEPEGDTDKGSSPVKFLITPERSGYMKYFVQVRMDGQDIFIPLGMTID